MIINVTSIAIFDNVCLSCIYYTIKGVSFLTLFIVIPERFERSTHALEGRCSIQLSYGTNLNCKFASAKIV